MRIVKEHDERKNEIIATAATLFAQKGYDQCSVNDILHAIGIAKGTFYHYFRSKEDVLDAVVSQTTNRIVARIQETAGKDLMPEDKLFQVFLAMRADRKEDQALLQEMHKTENALMHQKNLVACVTELTPVLTRIVEDGIQAGVFRCAYPEQSIQIFLSAAFTLLDDGIFHIVPEKNVTILRNDPSNTEIEQTVQLRKAIPSDVRKMDV